MFKLAQPSDQVAVFLPIFRGPKWAQNLREYSPLLVVDPTCCACRLFMQPKF